VVVGTVTASSLQSQPPGSTGPTEPIGPTEPSRGEGSSLVGLVPAAVRLRWKLSTNRLRRRGKRNRRLVYVFAVAYTILNVVVLGQARTADDAQAASTLVLLMTSMALGWVFGPVLIGGVDETIDPTRLALLPLTSRERYVIQLSSALTGIGPVTATAGLVFGLSIGHTRLGVSLVIVPCAALVAVLFMVGSARSLAAVLAIAQRSRVGRDMAVLLAALLGAAIFTMAQFGRRVLDVEGSPLIAFLGWLPWAWPARSINAARVGSVTPALGWLLVSAVGAVASHLLWARLSDLLLRKGERVAQARRRGDRALLNGATTEFGAVLSRQWIYLRRSPNNRVGIVFGTVFGVAFSLVQIAQQGEGSDELAAFGILLAMAANLGAATNVLGFDAGSLWLEVLAGGPTKVGLLGRQLIALPNLLLPTWLSGVVVAITTRQWTLVLLVALLAVPIAVNVLTFGTITSVVSPAPLPDLDNPFGNRQSNESRGMRIAVIAVTAMMTIITLSAPIFVLLGWVFASPARWIVPPVSLIYACALLWAASTWAAGHIQGREPKLIERLAPRAFN